MICQFLWTHFSESKGLDAEARFLQRDLLLCNFLFTSASVPDAMEGIEGWFLCRIKPTDPCGQETGAKIQEGIDLFTNLSLCAVTVFIWGSTCLGIKFRLGQVDPLVSVIYRFCMASVLRVVWCGLRGMNMRFAMGDHLFIALIISTLFEGYQWSPPAVAGVVVILAGNALSLAKRNPLSTRVRLAMKNS
jgi:hypothetical protein